MTTLSALGSDEGFTSGDLSTKGYIAVVPAYQSIYLADGRPYDADITASGYHKLDMVNTSLVGSPSGDFTAGEVVTQATSEAEGIFIETVGSGATAKNLVYRTSTEEFDTTNVVTGADSSETLTPSAVNAPPHWLNWILKANDWSDDGGSFPDAGSNIMCLYNGRIVMNSMNSPHQWFCTRQGYPTDLDISLAGDDAQAAQNDQTTQAGLVGDAITAFIPFKDIYLGFGCANSIWVLVGDPSSGIIRNVTEETGVFGPKSWCRDNEGNIYTVGTDGFYKIPAGTMVGNGLIDNISLRLTPGLFESLGLNRRTDRVVLGFDKKKSEVHISISMQDGTWACNFIYNTLADAIYPDEYNLDHIPASYLYLNSYKDSERDLIFGCYDGYIRKFDEDTKNDDGETINSHYLAGPIFIGDMIRASARIKDIVVTLSEDTDQLKWKLYSADSAEKIKQNIENDVDPTYSGTFSSGGRQFSIRHKVKGEFLAILFYNDTLNKSWGVERVSLVLGYAGRGKPN